MKTCYAVRKWGTGRAGAGQENRARTGDDLHQHPRCPWGRGCLSAPMAMVTLMLMPTEGRSLQPRLLLSSALDVASDRCCNT